MRTTRLLKIAPGLTAEQHRRAAQLVSEQSLDGIEMSSYGGAFGPVWDPAQEYDLDHLVHYDGIAVLRVAVRLRSLSGLAALAPGLRELSFGNPPGRPMVVDLTPVASCASLRAFGSGWRGLDYAPIANLAELRELALTGGGDERLALAASLAELRTLDISFGSATTLARVERLVHLEDFTARRVQKLGNVSALSEIPALVHVELDSLARVEALPALSACPALTTVQAIDLKALRDLDGLCDSHVREFVILRGSMPVEAFTRLAGHLPQLEGCVISLTRKADTVAVGQLLPTLCRPTTNDLPHCLARRSRTEWVRFDG